MNRTERGARLAKGFTIVELVVVVATIAILASLVTIGVSRYQFQTRDAVRIAKATSISEALEKYYQAHGEYPGCATLTSSVDTVVGNEGVLTGVERRTLVAPQANSDTTNSISCTDLTSLDGDDVFAYVGDGSTTCQTGTSCLNYTLKYKVESTNTIGMIVGRHNASVATSGNVKDLSITDISCKTASLAWSQIPNAIAYNVQAATNSGFSANLTSQTGSGLTATITGLNQGALYYFRVRPTFTSGQFGAWSNVPTSTTSTLATPSVTIGTISATSIAFSWGAIAGATGYSYEVASNSNFATIVASGTTSSTSATATGLTAGVQYWIRVKATKASCDDSAAGTNNATTTVSAPTGLTCTTNSQSQITASWNAVSGATSYTLNYSTNSGFSSFTPVNGITGTSQAITGLNAGTTHYCRVYAFVGSAQSAASSTASATTSVNTPSAPGMSIVNSGVVPYAGTQWVAWVDSPSAGNWYSRRADLSGSCPTGTTRRFNVSARYENNAQSWTNGPWNNSGTATSWYMVQPTSGYYVRFYASMWCDGPNADSASSGTTTNRTN